MKSKAAPFNQTSGGEEGSGLLNERCREPRVALFFISLFCPNQGQFEIASLQKKKVPVHIKREGFFYPCQHLADFTSVYYSPADSIPGPEVAL